MRQTQTLGDSLARRTWGSDSPLMRLVTFAPRRGARSGRCGPGPRRPCFVRFRGWTGIPTLTTLRVALLPPSRGTGSLHDAPAYGSNYRVWAGRQSDGYRTPQRTVARFVGAGPIEAIAYQEETERAGPGHMARLQDRERACRAVCLGGPCINKKINSMQKTYFSNRKTHSLYFHPAHGGGLYALTSMYVW